MTDDPLGTHETAAVEPVAPRPLSIRANMLWNSIGSLTNLGCQWLITILVVKLSGGYEAAGVLALAMSVYNIFGPFAVYRMYTYQVSDVRQENTVGEYLAFRIVTSGAALIGSLIYGAAISSPPDAMIAIGLFTLTRVFGLLIDVLHGFDQVNGRMDYIGKSLMAQGVLTFGAFIVIFSLTQSLNAALAGMAMVTIAVGLIWDLPRARRFGAIKVGISRGKAVYLLKYCFPIVVSGVACAAVPSIPRQYLSYLQGASMLGIYASVAAPVAVIQMSASYIYNPLLSVFSTYFVERRTAELNRLFGKVLLGIAGLGLACAVALEFLGPWLLRLLFGDSIGPYIYLMQPIILLAVISGYVWFFSDLLVVLRAFTGNVVGNVVALVAVLPVTYFFVDEWGMNGVSLAGIAAYVVAGIIMAVYIIRAFRRGPAVPVEPVTRLVTDD